jgi:DNA-binding MarR family transcriptional regulator
MPLQESTNLGFLIADVSRLLRRDFDRRVRALGLTQVQWRAIAHLQRTDGIRQSALAERLEVAPITLGRLVDRLEASGWVSRKSDPVDRRVSLLFLTPKAGPILDGMRAHAKDALRDALSGVPQRMRKELVKALERMKENLSAVEAPAAIGSTQGTNNAGTSEESKRRRAG